MRRVLFLLTLPLVVAVLASERAAACGDKFMRTGGGMLQTNYAPNYSASVLVFAPSRSGGASLLKEQKFSSALKKVGHKVVVAEDEAALIQGLKKGAELALVGYADLAVFEHAVDVAKKEPSVLTVTSKQTKSQVEACKLKYDCRLNANDRFDEYLKEMDKTMDARKKAAAAAAAAAGKK